MMPGEGNILRQEELAIIADPTTGWKSRRRFGEEVMTSARGKADIPHFIRAKASASTEAGMFESDLRNAPGFWPGRQRGIFHFHGVIEPAGTAGECDAARVVRTPNNRKAQILIRVIAVVVFSHMA